MALPKVAISTIRDIGLKTKWEPPKSDSLGCPIGEGELVTTINIKAVLEPSEIGEIAQICERPEAASAVIGSIQHVMAFAGQEK